MILKINNKRFDHFVNLSVNLKYDSVASTFSFGMKFDPDNAEHRALTLPFSYHKVEVEQDGETLITGTYLTGGFSDGPQVELVGISGYSTPGVLEDSGIPRECYPLQTNGLSLKNITEKIIKPFGIKLIIDPAVAGKASTNLILSKANAEQSCKSYISELAGQQHILVTHDELGNLVFTEAKANLTPVADYSSGMPDVTIEAEYNGQGMHSSIYVQKQASHKRPNAGKATVTNPYVTAYRPRIERQDSGNDVNTNLVARNCLSEELRDAVKVTVSIKNWQANNNKLIRPNQIITVTSPRCHIYTKTKFFVESVDYSGNAEMETAVLNCVLPEAFNNQTPKSIFNA